MFATTRYLLMTALLLFTMGRSAFAVDHSVPNLILIHKFSSLNGTVYFLPGAWVSVSEGAHLVYYRYHGGKFVPASNLPQLLRGWKSFDWADGLDSGSQMSSANYPPALNEFLPPATKVKKAEVFPRGSASTERLLLVCFTRKTAEEYPMASNDVDIYVAGFLSSKDSDQPVYTFLWIHKMESDVTYGNFSVQQIPGLGAFALLYWGSYGGSGGLDGLNVYQVTD